MNKFLITQARSALATFIALAVAVAILIYLGLYLLTNGGIVDSTVMTFHDFFAMFKSADVLVQQFKTGMQKYNRLEQLEVYALLILAAAPLVVLLSGFIRTNRFQFHMQSREIERQALWFFVPVWLLVAAALFISAWWAERGLAMSMLAHVWDSRSVDPEGWLVAGVRLLAALVSVVVVLGVLVPLAAWLTARQRGASVRWMARRLLRQAIYVPGLRRRVPLACIRRVEIQATGEGPRVLVLTLTGGGAWTVSQGGQRRLSRLGGVVARMAGLERRDFITWGR